MKCKILPSNGVSWDSFQLVVGTSVETFLEYLIAISIRFQKFMEFISSELKIKQKVSRITRLTER
jgi:hypothetical protein